MLLGQIRAFCVVWRERLGVGQILAISDPNVDVFRGALLLCKP